MASNLPFQTISGGYSLTNGPAGFLSPPTGKQINLFSARIVNQSGSTIDVAICKMFASTTSAWQMGTITAANSPQFTDGTAGIQGGGALNIFDTTNNDGFLVGAPNPFNIIGLTVSQADSGSPVYVVKYYNGSSYTTLTTQAAPTTYGTGTKLIVFNAPQDWVPGTTAAIGGNAQNYNIIVIATTAPGQITQANAAWVCQFLEFQPQLANNGSLAFQVMDSTIPLVLSGTEKIVPYFATAAAKNQMRVLYSING